MAVDLPKYAGLPRIADRTFAAVAAKREEIFLKVAIDGASGAGKTLSALFLAYGLVDCKAPPELQGAERAAWVWSHIGILDTENRSALLYANAVFHGNPHDFHVGAFQHYDFAPPYDPRYYIQAVRQMQADGILCAILDSITPEWDGRGGLLDIYSALGGKVTDWKVLTPLHQGFLDELRLSKMDVIATMRSKEDVVLEKNEAGKVEVRKMGLAPIQRQGVAYEFSLHFSADHSSHMCHAAKDRTRLFEGLGDIQITPEHGRMLGEWAQAGVSEIGSPQWLQRCLDAMEDCTTLESLQAEGGRIKRTGALLTPKQRDALNRKVTSVKARLEGKK